MCSKDFIPHYNRSGLYCSLICFWEYRRKNPEAYNRTNCICKRCGKKFYRRPAYLKEHGENGIFCSLKCLKGSPFKCLICKKEFHRKPSQVLKDGAGKYCSRKCKHIGQREGIEIVGESYQQRHLIRQSSKYKSFRLAAKKLRGNKCEKCGIVDGTICKCCGNVIHLHVHHIKAFAIYPQLRFDPTNSSVLCPKCHKDA